jgi:hypothetical protein
MQNDIERTIGNLPGLIYRPSSCGQPSVIINLSTTSSELREHASLVGASVGNGSRLCENSSVQFARRKFFSIWPI